MKTRTLTCIECPRGCAITALLEGKNIKSVTGNTCKRGYEYAQKELTHPTRTLTTTVRVKSGAVPLVPVKTSVKIPKEEILACMEILKHLKAEAPVNLGDILLENIAGTKADVIATKSVRRL